MTENTRPQMVSVFMSDFSLFGHPAGTNCGGTELIFSHRLIAPVFFRTLKVESDSLLGEAAKEELGRVYANLQVPDPKLRYGKNLIASFL